jgi:hypothetical protein
MAHGGGEEFIFYFIVYMCALVGCIVPGDFMFCFGRGYHLLGLEITGIVFLFLGALITLGISAFGLYATLTSTSYTDNDKAFAIKGAFALGLPILLIGLIPGLGCGLGLHGGL